MYVAYTRGDLYTGYYGGDAAYYMANGRGHFDDGGFSPLYSNPYDSDLESAKIYFQPHIFVLASLAKLLPFIHPGHIYLVFGLLFAWLAIRGLILLFEEVHGLFRSWDYLLLTICVWSGGIMVLGGIAAGILTSTGDTNIFRFDPGGGNWCLNFGRALWLPLEAFYHFLAVYLWRYMLKKKYIHSCICLLFLAASSPITGIHMLLFALCWCVGEQYFTGRMPWRFGLAVLTIFVLDVLYYLVWLPSHPEHAALAKQWTLAWTIELPSMILGYGPLAVFAVLAHRSIKRSVLLFGKPYQRLFLMLGLVTLALSNHEAFFTPHQPIHFTRGYDGISFFFLALPGLALFIRTIRRSLKGWLAKVVGVALVGLLVFDNVVWFAVRYRHYDNQVMVGLSWDKLAALKWLQNHETRSTVLVTQDKWYAIWVTLYTDLKVWHGHPYNTPAAEQRLSEVEDLLTRGLVLPEWQSRRVIAAIQPDQRNAFLAAFNTNNPDKALRLVFSNDAILLYLLEFPASSGGENAR